MKKTISFWDFRDDLDQFYSFEALEQLFDYLEELEGDIGEELDYDPVAIRCDYVEYSFQDLVQEYPDLIEDLDLDLENPDEEVFNRIVDLFRMHTEVAVCDYENDVIIIRNF